MSDEVRECLDILDRAIKFEETGMAFFLDRAENAPSELERNLFRSLAEDEKGHKAYLVQLKEQLLANNNPDDMQPEEDDEDAVDEGEPDVDPPGGGNGAHGPNGSNGATPTQEDADGGEESDDG